MLTTTGKAAMSREKSALAMERARKVIPGGVNSPVRAFKAIDGKPVFIKKARGNVLHDEDNNRFTDYCLSWGVAITGYNHPHVRSAVHAAIDDGTSFGAATEYEVVLAEKITSHIPSIEKIRLVNSGTEAVMSAIRLARAYTGKQVIIKFDGCYHGHSDSLLVSAGSGLAETKSSSSGGVPDELVQYTISLPFNNELAVTKAFEKYHQQIAAVIVEPVAANMGLIKPRQGFLDHLARVTQENKALLIFDEVITGYRFGLSGAQGYYNIKPDLTCLGKIIGGGFPAGAFGGKAAIMDLLAPEGPVYQAGTLSGNPVAVRAGIATLELLEDKDFYRHIDMSFLMLKENLTETEQEFNVTIHAYGNMFSIFFGKHLINNFSDVVNSNTTLFGEFYKSMLTEGIYLSPSPFETHFISSAHTIQNISDFNDALKKSLKKISAKYE